MTLDDFEFKVGNHFVAMEYYGLIMNRTLLVLLLGDHLAGLQVNGMVAVEGGRDLITRAATGKMAIKNDLENPYAYINSARFEKLKPYDVLSDEIIDLDKANFRIPYVSIKQVAHDPKKKWGMGHYPHDGKINITTVANRKKELIPLGSQSGNAIARWIKEKK